MKTMINKRVLVSAVVVAEFDKELEVRFARPNKRTDATAYVSKSAVMPRNLRKFLQNAVRRRLAKCTKCSNRSVYCSGCHELVSAVKDLS